MPQSYYKIGGDIFETGGRKLDLPEFQSLGLNVDLLSTDPNAPTPLEQGRDVETRAFVSTGGQLGQESAAQQAGFGFTPSPQGTEEGGTLTVPEGINIEGFTRGLTPEAQKMAQNGFVSTGALPQEQEGFYKAQEESYKRLNEIASKIMSLGMPNEEVKKTQEQLNQEITGSEQGIADIMNRPSSQGFITGAAAAAERQANVRIGNLQRQLQLQQGNQELQLNTLKTAYDLTRTSVQDALAFYQKTSPENLAILQDQGIMLMRSPVTGQTWSVPIPGWKAPAEKPVGPIEVSPGATLYDPITGRSIFTAPTTKQIGGGGTGGGAGAPTPGTSTPTNLTTTQKSDVSDMKTILTQLDSIDELSELKGAVGFFTGPLESAALKFFGKGNEHDAEVRAIIGNVKGQLAKIRGGTSFTENEEKLLASYVPNINESAESIVAKVRALRTYISSKLNQIYSTAGGMTESTADPLNLFK